MGSLDGGSERNSQFSLPQLWCHMRAFPYQTSTFMLSCRKCWRHRDGIAAVLGPGYPMTGFNTTHKPGRQRSGMPPESRRRKLGSDGNRANQSSNRTGISRQFREVIIGGQARHFLRVSLLPFFG